MSIERVYGSALERAALDQLLQFYVYDFAEFLPPERRVHLRDDGRFPPLPHVDDYWTEADRSVWLMRVEGALCGFALLNRHSHAGLAVDFNVGEYFVARPYRRTGIGAKAISELLKRHPGVWEIAIGARNLPAQSFWPLAIASVPIDELQTLHGDGVHWTGPILRFRVSATR